MKRFLSQRGFNLTELMVAVGLLGGLSLAGMYLFENQDKAKKQVIASYDVSNVVQQMRLTLAIEENCVLSLSGKNPANGVPDRLFRVVQSIPKQQYLAGSVLPGMITVQSYKLSKSHPTLLADETLLMVNFLRGKGAINESITKFIKITYTLNGLVIDKCSATAVDSGIWNRFDSSPANIFFDTYSPLKETGLVGIGVDNPQRALHIGLVPGNGGIRIESDSSPTNMIEVVNPSQSRVWALESAGGISEYFDFTHTAIPYSYVTRLNTQSKRFIIGSGGTPANTLDVAGTATLGAAYITLHPSGTSTVPSSNGLLVDGDVGVGLTTTEAKLHVQGALVSMAKTSTIGVVDFSTGNVQRNTFATSDGAISLCGLQDGGSYTLVLVSQPLNSTPVFTAFADSACTSPLTFTTGGVVTKTTSSKTVMSIIRSGNTAYASWAPGFGSGGSTPCAAVNPRSWTVSGQTCSANLAGAPSGASSMISASGSPAGSANFTCNNGVWTENSGATCGAAVGCASVSPLNWTVSGNDCTHNLPYAAHGGTSTVVDSYAAGTATGSKTFSCNNGVWTPTGTPTCSFGAACPDTYVSWAQGPNQCYGSVSGGSEGVSRFLSPNPGTNEATFQCTGGRWVKGTSVCSGGMTYDNSGSTWYCGSHEYECPSGWFKNGNQNSYECDGSACGSIGSMCPAGQWAINCYAINSAPACSPSGTIVGDWCTASPPPEGVGGSGGGCCGYTYYSHNGQGPCPNGETNVIVSCN